MTRRLALWPLRVAIFDRLTSELDGYRIRRDGEGVEYPEIDLGPLRMADRSTDTHGGGEYVAQLDFWAAMDDGGGQWVPEAMDAALDALSTTLAVDGFGHALFMSVSEALVTEDYDERIDRALYHGVLQVRYAIYQP